MTFCSLRRVIKSKKSGGYYPIPFSISFTLGNAQRSGADTLLVEPRADVRRIDRVEEGIAFSLEGLSEKFTERNYARRARHLRQFVEYLKGAGHSMRLQDLTQAHGIGFLHKLTNVRTGEKLSLAIIQDYESARRSFSRSLVQSDMLN